MRILKLSILNITRSKYKSIIYITIISLLVSFYYLSWGISNLLNRYIDESILKDKSLNEITIQFGEEKVIYNEITKIKDIDGIVDVNYFLIDSNIKITVDDYNNIESISSNVDKIINKTYNNYEITYNDSKLYEIKFINNINRILKILVLMILLIIILSLILTINQSINDRISEIVIYKSIGYSNLNLFKLLFYECILIVTVSNIISFIVSKGLIILFKKLLRLYFFVDLNSIKYTNLIDTLIIFGLIYLICVISSILSINKIRKLSIKSIIDLD
jgi:putative ABC transport system permease protein